ncbi:hypothetical protein EDB85DRAFT_1892819 [Lactarius pseudohatsudake]|nr:hypothetical protein EDB85DRAFT_1892819 [Lactarius pseudohatsudake]
MSAEAALTRAEVDYREANIDSKIRQYLTAPSQEHSDESFAGFIMAIDLIIFLVQLTRKDKPHSPVRGVSVALPAALVEVAAVVEVNTNIEHIVAAGTWRPLSPRCSVFEKSSQTSGAGEDTAEGGDRRIPKATRSVSKLILSMRVSAILGSAWVGGAMKNWPSALRKRASACDCCRDMVSSFGLGLLTTRR